MSLWLLAMLIPGIVALLCLLFKVDLDTALFVAIVMLSAEILLLIGLKSMGLLLS